MNPIIILPPDTMSEADIKTLRDNDLCVVVAADPSKVKFVDPIPAASSRTEIENAAVHLSRKLLNGHGFDGSGYATWSSVAKLYCQLLSKGTPLDINEQPHEIEKKIFDQAKAEEIRQIAREEARAEREAKKASKVKK